eukprot:2843016-Ditylum_brightwellii.AAC.1
MHEKYNRLEKQCISLHCGRSTKSGKIEGHLVALVLLPQLKVMRLENRRTPCFSGIRCSLVGKRTPLRDCRPGFDS